MKPRRVLVTLELETDMLMAPMKKAGWWQEVFTDSGWMGPAQAAQSGDLGASTVIVHQAQVNAIRSRSKRKVRR